MEKQIIPSPTNKTPFSTEIVYMGGFPSFLLVKMGDEQICRFFYNMRGFLPDFALCNQNGTYWHFPERTAGVCLSELKKAVKSGFTNITLY